MGPPQAKGRKRDKRAFRRKREKSMDMGSSRFQKEIIVTTEVYRPS